MIALMPVRRPPAARQGPFRFRPSAGEPRCVLEQFAQHVWTHKLAWYVAAVTTLTMLLVLLPAFGVEVSLR